MRDEKSQHSVQAYMNKTLKVSLNTAYKPIILPGWLGSETGCHSAAEVISTSQWHLRGPGVTGLRPHPKTWIL